MHLSFKIKWNWSGISNDDICFFVIIIWNLAGCTTTSVLWMCVAHLLASLLRELDSWSVWSSPGRGQFWIGMLWHGLSKIRKIIVENIHQMSQCFYLLTFFIHACYKNDENHHDNFVIPSQLAMFFLVPFLLWENSQTHHIFLIMCMEKVVCNVFLKALTLNHFAVVEEVFMLYLRDITSVPVPDYSSTECTLYTVCRTWILGKNWELFQALSKCDNSYTTCSWFTSDQSINRTIPNSSKVLWLNQ